MTSKQTATESFSDGLGQLIVFALGCREHIRFGVCELKDGLSLLSRINQSNSRKRNSVQLQVAVPNRI